MSLHYVIDGYNVIKHSAYGMPTGKSGDSRISLLALIRDKKLCGSSKNKVTVVFDGGAGMLQHDPRIHYANVVFSGDETADKKIKKLVSTASNPKTIVVVSDDRDIALFIRSLGAQPMGVAEFLAKGYAPAPKSSGDHEIKVNYSQMQKINEEMRKRWLDKG